MATFTLLQMTQNILSALDSDSVNSISDTPEATQVAQIIQNKYYDIVARGDLTSQQVLYQLTPSNDSTKPTLMYIPSATAEVQWVKYFDSNPDNSPGVSQYGSYSHGVNLDITSATNWYTTSTTSNSISIASKTFTVASSTVSATVGQYVMATSGANSMFGTLTSYSGTTMVINVTSIIGSGTYAAWTITNATSNSVPGYKYVTMLDIESFLDMINRFNPADSNVNTFVFTEGANSFNFFYKNDHQPQYCCIIENYYVIFDSYDSVYDSTLQASKSLVLGNRIGAFSLTDSFVPDLDDNQFSLLVNEAKSLAFFELKQTPHTKADQEIRRQWSVLQKTKSLSNKPSYFDQLPNMGRVPRTGGYSSGGYGAYKWMRQTGP